MSEQRSPVLVHQILVRDVDRTAQQLAQRPLWAQIKGLGGIKFDTN